MDLDRLQEIWQDQDKKLDRNWQLNLEVLRRSNLDKARNKIRSLTWMIGATLAFFALCAIGFAGFTVSHWDSPHVTAAGVVLTLWTVWISSGAMRQLGFIANIDYAAPIPVLQKQLQELRLIIVSYLQKGVWIFPFYMAFVIWFFQILFGIDIIEVGNRNWLIAQGFFSVILILPTLWAYRKLDRKNIDTKWMQTLLRGQGSQIADALGFIREIEAFEKEGSEKK